MWITIGKGCHIRCEQKFCLVSFHKQTTQTVDRLNVSFFDLTWLRIYTTCISKRTCYINGDCEIEMCSRQIYCQPAVKLFQSVASVWLFGMYYNAPKVNMLTIKPISREEKVPRSVHLKNFCNYLCGVPM